jgi:alkylated DNA repair dioxygenase AlkB
VRVFGRLHPVPRLVCWYGDPGCSYRYSGHRHDPLPWTPPLAALRDQLRDRLGWSFNSLLLNHYRHGAERMGWHADDEPELAADHPIASLSLGVMRTLRFRPRPAPRRGAPSLAWGQPPLALDLADGDLLLMEPPTQQHWQHGLPARRREGGERFNLTFRRIQT